MSRGRTRGGTPLAGRGALHCDQCNRGVIALEATGTGTEARLLCRGCMDKHRLREERSNRARASRPAASTEGGHVD